MEVKTVSMLVGPMMLGGSVYEAPFFLKVLSF